MCCTETARLGCMHASSAAALLGSQLTPTAPLPQRPCWSCLPRPCLLPPAAATSRIAAAVQPPSAAIDSLHEAAKWGDAEAAQRLLDLGADVNQLVRKWHTCLQTAAAAAAAQMQRKQQQHAVMCWQCTNTTSRLHVAETRLIASAAAAAAARTSAASARWAWQSASTSGRWWSCCWLPAQTSTRATAVATPCCTTLLVRPLRV